jgi:hypothetical protein
VLDTDIGVDAAVVVTKEEDEGEEEEQDTPLISGEGDTEEGKQEELCKICGEERGGEESGEESGEVMLEKHRRDGNESA